MKPITIYHNPRCSKSRAACALIAERRLEARIIDYLTTPPSRDELLVLLDQLGMEAEDLVRRGEAVFKESYAGREMSDEQWLDALLAHPILIERPIVVRGDQAVIGRPTEKVLALLDSDDDDAMKRILLLLLALACMPLAAQDVRRGEVLRVATRDGVSVPLYAYWRDSALATVVLFSGGAGGYGKIADDGWPASGNFLIRTGKRWTGHPSNAFNVVMVGRPSDGIDLALGAVRAGQAHAADNVAIFKEIKRKSPAPLWVVGTSMGTISATAAAIGDSDNLIAGVVLTSSIVADKIPGAVTTQALEKIRVPVLVLHHENDACALCRPDEAKSIAGELTNAPVKKTVFVNGGSGASGNPCAAFHYHGFVGMENDAVDLVAAWIVKPTI